ncbi:hypothetical protein H072_2824 [Dactylellina haptotyla CBS 200.50]|uniref:ATPase inhibitor, mitochondrial n=1 Tax=Dactylellina haptotyla (strain CBS 200.50) TaxID=1284197 RepID=S8AQ11_DACHA|nr:hypothetical protein H072_2824 [Dactylellina haptotyla CBS 200.50]
MTLRIALTRTVARLPRTTAFRPATSLIMNRGYTEGATGGVRSGGVAASDQFSRREKAQEDLYIMQREKERIAKLKEKLQAQRKHLDDLAADIEELEKAAGGEHN